MRATLQLGCLCLLLGCSLGSASMTEPRLFKNLRPKIPPSFFGVPSSFNVEVIINITDIISLDMTNMDMTVAMHFQQFWKDSRLAFGVFNNKEVIGGKEILEKIWHPDTFFVNEREQDFLSKHHFVRILPTGDILWSQKLRVKFECPMNLQRFPFDSQICSLEIQSFGHNMEYFEYSWKDGNRSIEIAPDISLPNFCVDGSRHRTIMASLSTGNYSRLVADIQLTRAPWHYAITIFIPVSILVATSWISFWISPGLLVGRLCLLVPHMIIILCIIIGIQILIIPEISYTTGLTIYVYFSLFIVLLAAVEFILVTVLHYCLKSKDGILQEKLAISNWKFGTDHISTIDTISRILFPMIFVIFQCFFFGSYQNTDEFSEGLIPVSKPTEVEDIIKNLKTEINSLNQIISDAENNL